MSAPPISKQAWAATAPASGSVAPFEGPRERCSPLWSGRPSPTLGHFRFPPVTQRPVVSRYLTFRAEGRAKLEAPGNPRATRVWPPFEKGQLQAPPPRQSIVRHLLDQSALVGCPHHRADQRERAFRLHTARAGPHTAGDAALTRLASAVTLRHGGSPMRIEG